ncbi:mannose-6-phosphate isomerase, type 1 [Frankia casuarinae]|uniref:Mannose-6-phosphate isomerase, type 1 n=1 Tax=Frankia casuarinae (strain DSM 45818 / CECT 9043 / HFP020203 / CcI3) TaxID=106370 RepID=Q2JF10_FRACC|nr:MULTISPECIES: type I phosphomannose isomerase catalytic subunit [Frankia]ABD10132.1 mannose-6-phosphate isomerase, type 1 [Frankia casuarinae]ETA04156.1 mannose-6-phosphate isomerase, type 1 [Frankia sp. CcI6]EYT93999.1 mannose-6-phosphate isomerase, type 1 [Frankia casuarinae]KDA44624.1 mannose-6-phosphate isomerase, type 1 [Frankia sp. BMG5.23]KFB05627.1 mannose-6-phosphate isomerase, type 1 [Frankia sp. Allo2]
MTTRNEPARATASGARVLPLHGQAQSYAWGSPTAIPNLLGAAATGEPVAELWLGTHPVATALAEDDGIRRPATDLVGQLPFLLKVLAAEKALSLQVHPDLAQARAGFDADDAAGLGLGDPRRRYRDRNHKPELIVALSPFRALAGMRDPGRTLAIVARLGSPALTAAFRPLADDPSGGAAQVLRSLLTMPREPARDLVRGLVATARRLAAGPYGAAAPTAPGPPSAETDDTATDGAAVDGAEADDVARAADLIGLLAAAHPGDVGIAAALLLNDVTLRPGEGLFQPARLLHAYVSGLGIEIMAASDNVLRGGLTPKHIDVDELLRILDPTPSAAPILMPRTLAVSSGGLLRGWDVPVGDFALTEAICTGGALDVGRPMLLLAIEGAVRVTGTADDGTTVAPVELRGGRSALLAGSAALTLTGTGRVFLAASGR